MKEGKGHGCTATLTEHLKRTHISCAYVLHLERCQHSVALFFHHVGTREEKDIADGLGAFMGAGGAAVGGGVQVWLVLGWGLVGDAVGLSWGTR
jgi:hypothetical protein